ncbi:MAG: hypothetical protein Kow0059_08980 [Candidatus Sumerlaeia bacterium]
MRLFTITAVFAIILVAALGEAPDGFPPSGAGMVLRLEDDVFEAARSGEGPDTAVAFSPDESIIAVATYGGGLVLFDTQHGRQIWKHHIAEGLIRCLAFSPDGAILYAGELSPDGSLYAIDTATRSILWSYRTADDLGTAPLPAQRNRFSIYGLPGVYHVQSWGPDRVVFSAFHSTFARDGRPQQHAYLYCMSQSGRLIWKYPGSSPLPRNIMHFTISPGAQGAVVGLSSAGAAAASGSPAVLLGIGLESGRPVWQADVPPFSPWFSSVFFWRSTDVSPSGATTAASTNDGRLFVLNTAGGWKNTPADQPLTSQTLVLVQPMRAGDVYLSALAGYCRTWDDLILVESQQTIAPAGAVIQSDSPPLPHPQANRVFGLTKNETGAWTLRWTWKGDGVLNGLSADAKGRRALIIQNGGAARAGRNDWTGSGSVVVEIRDDSGTPLAAPRELMRRSVAGELYFNSTISPSGMLLALIETPHWVKSTDTIVGQYQVHLIPLAPARVPKHP